MAEDEMAEAERPWINYVAVPNLLVSKAKGKVCLKIIRYDYNGMDYVDTLIHSNGCSCGWSDK